MDEESEILANRIFEFPREFWIPILTQMSSWGVRAPLADEMAPQAEVTFWQQWGMTVKNLFS